MAPPSKLAIATGSTLRLVKEEESYHKELASQQARLEKILASDDGDENKEYQVKQERAAIEETRAIFPPLRQRVADSLVKLQDRLETAEENDGNAEEITKAKEAIEKAKAATSKK